MDHHALDPPHTLHVAAPGEVGGLERVVTGLARGQRCRGGRVSVAAVVDAGTESDHPFLHLLRDTDVGLHVIPVPPRSYLLERRRLSALLESERPDVVHTHGYRPDVLAAPLARARAIPTVTTVHGFTGGDWKNRLYERLQRRSHRSFDAVVAVSRPLEENLRNAGIPRERIHVIRNAWAEEPSFLPTASARAHLGVPGGEPLVGWVGRLSEEKGPDLLVRSLAQLPDPRVRACAVGVGRMAPKLRTLANELGVAGRVSWLGQLPEAVRYFRAFDAFLLTSRTEGTPMVLFEAMAARVPIIATRVGGVPDLLSEDEALLVPPEDPGAVAAAMERTFRDPAAAMRRAAAAEKRLHREFGSTPWIRAYDGLYRSLLGDSPRPAVEGAGPWH